MSHYFENDNNLPSEIVKYSVSFNNKTYTFNTDNGVFSKGELDFGTYLLIKNVLSKKISGDILDLGCGYGPIGIILSSVVDSVTMIDVNKRAIHLVNMNAKDNDINNISAIVSNGYENIDQKFDYIISNPPIRVGKEKLYELLIDSRDHLKEGGEMIIVVRKEQGAKSLIKDMSVYYDVNILDKDKGFFIISLK